jgi:hypothetical protein
MGLLTFSINVTLDGCVDHREGIADDETHAFFTRLMDESEAMLWGRVTYEMMESYWPAVARGDEKASPALREWAVKLDAKPKYVVATTRKEFRWNIGRAARKRRGGDALPSRALIHGVTVFRRRPQRNMMHVHPCPSIPARGSVRTKLSRGSAPAVWARCMRPSTRA